MMKSDRFLIIYSAAISTITLLVIISLFTWNYFQPNNEFDAIDYLTTDEISLMDWGINNLEEAVRRTDSPLLKKHGELIAFLGNKILITSSTNWELAPDEDTAIIWCKGLISEMKERFNIDPTTGHPKYGDNSSIYVYFQHEGYQSKSVPENFGELLDKIIELGAVVHINDSEKQIECHSPLLSPKAILGEINYGT